MSALMVNEAISFNELKELIQVTDGNPGQSLKALEETNYVKVTKGFVGRKTNTTYSVTKAGEGVPVAPGCTGANDTSFGEVKFFIHKLWKTKCFWK